MLPERTVYATRLHWRTMIPGLLVATVAAVMWMVPAGLLLDWTTTVLFGVVDDSRVTLAVDLVRMAAVTLFIIGLVIIVSQSILLAVARFTVTNRRLMLKTGALKRRYVELSLDNVEAVTVSQSMLARFLNYGTVVITGTGSTREMVRHLAQPNEFRRHMMEQNDQRRTA